MVRFILVALASVLTLTACAAPTRLTAPRQAASPRETFSNPLLPSGPDPWITQIGGVFYYTHTLSNRIALWRTRHITDLAHARMRTVWTPPRKGPNARAIWAPELHRIHGKWYLYYSATASGKDGDHQRGVFVLENDAADPLTGDWIDRGRLNTRHSGIDGTIFEQAGKRYFVYSPYIGSQSYLAIARMTNPWTLADGETVIARPDHDWEKQGGRQILEGPEFLRGPRGDLFLTYSASACWSDDYALGLLHAASGSDPLDPSAWRKSPRPVFSHANGVYATGHNGFFVSPDGTENWIVYHANPGPNMGCTSKRAPHIQRFTWTDSGWPKFGEPLPEHVPIPAPSGTRSRP